MEKQGASFADRPHSIAGSEILGRGMRFMLLSSGDRLRRFRKSVTTVPSFPSFSSLLPLQGGALPFPAKGNAGVRCGPDGIRKKHRDRSVGRSRVAPITC